MRSRLIWAAVLLAAASLACNFPQQLVATPTPEPSATFTALPPTETPPATETPLPPTETPTQAPPTEILPTPLPPTSTSPPAPPEKRISFAAGEISATATGDLPPYSVQRFVIKAAGGQTMNVGLSPSDGKAYMTIWGANGVVLAAYNTNTTQWSGQLPASQDYFIEVRNTTGSGLKFALQVTIPPLNPTPVVTGTQRIEFAAGATTASVPGQVAAGRADRYVLRVTGGQTLIARLGVQSGQAILVVYGADGTLLLSGSAGATKFSGTVAATQDYYLDVRNIGPDKARYVLEVEVPPGIFATPTSPPPSGQRIEVPAGSAGVELSGQVGEGRTDRYVISGEAGKTLSVRAMLESGKAVLAVYGADGTVLLSGASAVLQWSGTLPSTQDYYIEVRNTGQSKVRYTLQVLIPQV